MPITLPPEEGYSDTELTWIENEPPNLFPGDQTSVWGQIRKIFADYLEQNIRDVIDRLNSGLNPETAAEEELVMWEEMLGIPYDPSKSVVTRRAFIAARRHRGAFTRTLRRTIVELFVTATFGPAVQLTPGGVPLTEDGVPLYSGLDSMDDTYQIIEDIPNFSYSVELHPAVGVDEDGLNRELARITPAHITFTLDELEP